MHWLSVRLSRYRVQVRRVGGSQGGGKRVPAQTGAFDARLGGLEHAEVPRSAVVIENHVPIEIIQLHHVLAFALFMRISIGRAVCLRSAGRSPQTCCRTRT